MIHIYIFSSLYSLLWGPPKPIEIIPTAFFFWEDSTFTTFVQIRLGCLDPSQHNVCVHTCIYILSILSHRTCITLYAEATDSGYLLTVTGECDVYPVLRMFNHVAQWIFIFWLVNGASLSEPCLGLPINCMYTAIFFTICIYLRSVWLGSPWYLIALVRHVRCNCLTCLLVLSLHEHACIVYTLSIYVNTLLVSAVWSTVKSMCRWICTYNKGNNTVHVRDILWVMTWNTCKPRLHYRWE